MKENVFPDDVVTRANDILSTIHGSTGCYSESVGLPIVRKHIAEYITKRDGYPSNINDIIVTNGASSSVKVIFLYRLIFLMHKLSFLSTSPFNACFTFFLYTVYLWVEYHISDCAL